MNRYILLILMTVLGLTSCWSHKSEMPDVKKGEPRYKYIDGPDYVTHFTYEVNKTTGIQIVYKDFDIIQLKWNLGVRLAPRIDSLALQSDTAQVALGLRYLNTILLQYYPDSFKKKYFPYRIYLTDKIYSRGYRGRMRESRSKYLVGRDYIALNNVNSSLQSASSYSLQYTKGSINGALWGTFIYANNLLDFPEEFFAPVEQYYDLKIPGSDVRGFKIKSIGFFKDGGPAGLGSLGPSREKDISSFIEKITGEPYSKLMQEMEGYEVLKSRYMILTSYFKDKYGLDLQAIGDSQVSQIK